MDPISLLVSGALLLVKEATSFIAEEAAGGFVGGRADDAYRRIAATVVGRVREGRVPLNHDVLRVMRGVYLMSTRLAVSARIAAVRSASAEAPARGGGDDAALIRAELRWLDALHDRIDGQVRALDGAVPDRVTVTATSELRSLLRQFDRDDSPDALRERLLDEVVAEFAGCPPGTELTSCPLERRGFVRYVREGWVARDREADARTTWYALFVAFFQDEYKRNPVFRAAVSGDLLADLPGEGDALQVDDLMRAVEAWAAPLIERTTAEYRLVNLGLERVSSEMAEFRRAVLGEVRRAREDIRGLALPRPPAASVSADDEQGLLRRYLAWLIDSMDRIELPGLPAGRRGTVPLEDVFVTLRGGLGGSYEMQRGRAVLEALADRLEMDDPTALAHAPGERYRRRWRAAAAAALRPLPSSLSERDRVTVQSAGEARLVSLAEAFRTERRLVVLGDPGSGKTTLARWITVRFARALLAEQPDARVPRRWVEPDAGAVDGEVSLGAARVPILVRVGQFAQRLAQEPDERLITFLGHHLATDYGEAARDSATGEEIDPVQLNGLLRRLLQENKAIVILDGLDEVNDPDHRHAVVREIDRFLDAVLPVGGAPHLAGGNQAMVTSRKVGYDQVPLGTEAVTLIIEPMEQEAVERFCDLWVRAYHRAVAPSGRWDERAADEEAESLKGAVVSLQDRGGRELTATPLLLTILALIHHNGRTERGAVGFPRARVQLYGLAVRVLIKLWQDRARAKGERVLPERDVLGVLTPLAEHIHTESSVGLIDERALHRFLGGLLPESELASFLTLVREEVGLLTDRGEGVYGFLHLTFQEYLAARALAADPDRLLERIFARAHAPRWHEPVLMAFGQASNDLSEEALERLLTAFLDRPDPLGGAFPRAEALLISALPDMERVPDRVLEVVLRRLLGRYTDPEVRTRLPGVRRDIERLAGTLVGSAFAAQAERILVGILRAHRQAPTDLGWAAARVIREVRFYTLATVAALHEVIDLDSEGWEWPIDAALRDVACRCPDLLPTDRRCLKATLIREPALREALESDPAWLRVALALYGGTDITVPERILELQRKRATLYAEIERLNEVDPELLPRETRIERTQELDTAMQEVDRVVNGLKPARRAFEVARIHRDSPITPVLLAALRAGCGPKQWTTSFAADWQRLLASPDPSTVRDAHLAWLLAVVPDAAGAEGLLRTLPAEARERLGSACRRVLATVRIPAAAAAADLIDRARFAAPDSSLAPAALRALLEICARGGEIVKPTQVVQHGTGNAQAVAVAELLAVALSPESNRAYDWAVHLDVLGKWLGDADLLARSLALLPGTVFLRRDPAPRFIAYDPFAIDTGDLTERVAAALDAIASLPEDLDFVKGWILEKLATPLAETGLLPEALVLAQASLPAGVGVLEPALAALNAAAARSGTSGAPAGEPGSSPYAQVRRTLRLLECAPCRMSPGVGPGGGEKQDAPGSGTMGVLRRLFALGRVPGTRAPAPSSGEDGLDEAALIAAAQRVDRADHRAKALLQVLRFVGPERQPECFALAATAARRIASPLQQAAALGRLGAHPLAPDPEGLWKEALDACERASPEDRPTLIAALDEAIERAALPTRSTRELRSRAHRIAVRLGKPAEDVARRASAAVIDRFFDQEASAPLNVLLAAATLSDVERVLDTLAQETDAPAPAPTEVVERRARALLAQTPIPLDGDTAKLLDAELRAGDPHRTAAALQRFASPHPAAIPMVRRWSRSEHALVRDLAGLLLAEAGELTPRTLEAVFRRLDDEEVDLPRLRAGLLLSGGAHQRLRWNASALGEETLRAIAARAIEYELGADPRRGTLARWFFERVVHDDPALIRRLADLGTRGGSVARCHDPNGLLLRQLHHVAPAGWPAVAEALAGGPPDVQYALLLSISKLAHLGRLSLEQWEDVLAVVPALDGEWLSVPTDTVDPFRGVLSALDALGPETAALSPLELSLRADAEYTRRVPTLSDLLQSPGEAVPDRLTAWGGTRFTGRHRTIQTLRAARRVVGTPERLPLLLRWIAGRAENGVDVDEEIDLGGALVELTAVATERLPDTFITAARELEHLEPGLCEIARFANSFPARAAAFTLLSFRKELTPGVMVALRTVLSDNPIVQEAAIATLDRYAQVDLARHPHLLDDLRSAADGPSAALADVSVRLLERIALNQALAPATLASILEGIASAVHQPGSQRPVFTYGGNWTGNGVGSIVYGGQLRDRLYDALVRLSGFRL